MTNLSDLFPAGAGKQVSFTASGNVTSSGKPVILNSDGTVSEVSGSSSTVGAVSAAASSQPDYVDMASSGTYLVTIYKRSSAIYARPGTISGSTITWGTELQIFSSGTYWSGYPAICYDSTNDKFIISWTQRGDLMGTQVTKLNCSPLTVNAGSPVTLSNGSVSLVAQAAGLSAFYYNNMAYSPDTNHFVMVNAFGLNSFYGVAYVGQHDGASGVSVNTTGYTFNSVNSTDYTRVGYDQSADRFVITYLDSPGGYSGIRTGLAAGSAASSSMTFGTEVQLANYGYNVIPVYDSSASKTVLVYKSQTSSQGEAVVATVGSTTITLASTIYVWQANSNAPTTDMIDASFDSNLNQVVISWREGNSPYYSYFLGASVSGEVITYGTSTVAISANTQNRALAFNSGSNLTGIFAINATAGDGSAVMVAPATTNVTASNFLGISDAAISSAASGNITIKGGIAATGLSSLTPGSDYYVQIDGTFGTSAGDPSVKAGKALSATAINLEYTS